MTSNHCVANRLNNSNSILSAVLHSKELASSPHISKHRLVKMPSQKLIDWPTRILTKLFIEVITGNTLSIGLKTNNLIIILKQLLISD